MQGIIFYGFELLTLTRVHISWREIGAVYSPCLCYLFISLIEIIENFLICSIKFIYSEKATKFCEISTLLLSYVVPVKSKVEISQNFVAFSEYMNFTKSI